LRPGGHLAIVEGGVSDPDDARALDAALHAAGLSIVATSVCRGIGLAERVWGYIGAVAVKDGQGDGSLAGGMTIRPTSSSTRGQRRSQTTAGPR
jgi:hypothetical protein